MNDILLRMIGLNGKGFCCSQILLILALEAQGKTNPDLVRSMAGLCFGLNAGEVCGALSGGVCLISLHAAKGEAEEVAHDRFPLMVDELVRWFRDAAEEEYGGTRCDDILERFPDRSICGQIVADTYRKCMEILVSYGYDPAAARNG